MSPIDHITKLPSMKESDLNTMQRILDNIHNQATGTTYADNVDKAKKLAERGKLVVCDTGCERRIYFKTGKGFVGYLNLTEAV